MYISQADRGQLIAWESAIAAQYEKFRTANLHLDLTRGKPSPEQLALSDSLDGILGERFLDDAGTDTRNYGGLEGLPAMRNFAAELLEVNPEEVLVGGNSSLNLMYWAVQFCWMFGPAAGLKPWRDEPHVKFLCPSPGYDRHFAICEEFGIEMIPVAVNRDGPDMDEVERLIAGDAGIKGIWCVPKYSNPTGCVYSDETVARLAGLGRSAAENFRIFYDNAYAVHHLTEEPPTLTPIMAACRRLGTEDAVLQFSSTSKITFAGAGVSFLAASPANLAAFKKHLGIATIGADKVNQLRHLRFIDSMEKLQAHMKNHAKLLRPRFDAVLGKLDAELGDSDLGSWSRPRGGYFVSFDARPGTAREIVRLAGEVGVKLTPAGATYPYGRDPADSNIRLAPSFPALEEIERAMEVFVCCVKLASVRQQLNR